MNFVFQAIKSKPHASVTDFNDFNQLNLLGSAFI